MAADATDARTPELTAVVSSAGPSVAIVEVAGVVSQRARALVESCALLVYDRSVSPRLVHRAVGAARLPREILMQDDVNRLLVHHGRARRRVVRLIGGDPFRAGGRSEAHALTQAWMPHELVLSARATPSSHISANSAAALVRRVEAGELVRVADDLILAGRSISEPAAVATFGATDGSRIILGTLGTIAAAAATLTTPTWLLVGEFGSLASRLRILAEAQRVTLNDEAR